MFVVFAHHATVLRCLSNIRNSYHNQALNSSISLQGLSGQDFPQAVSFPNSALSFVVASAVTGTYQLYVAISFVVQVFSTLTDPQHSSGCWRRIFFAFFCAGHKSSTAYIDLEATDGYCQYWCGAHCAASLVYSQLWPFNCGATGPRRRRSFLYFRRRPVI